jgi:F-type H+-transporting ATPase subunit epsilon
MAAPFSFELVTPDRSVFSGEAEMVSMRTEGGDIAFLAGHVQFIGSVEIGVLTIVLPDQSEVQATVHGGLVEVRDNKVVLVAGVSELGPEIDVERAERARQAAEAALAENPDDADAEAALARAKARLELVQAARP